MKTAQVHQFITRFFRHNSQKNTFSLSEEWQYVQYCIESSNKMIDLGCGTNPHPHALVAVDAFINPEHRQVGCGPAIDPKNFISCKFVLADITRMPFSDKEFDFAYSHHVFEHLHDPKSACREVMRIAHRGAIITPSPFSEIAFGRPYHLWLVFSCGNTILFVRKKRSEDRPFGEHPILSGNKWKATEQTNPFDILLNDGNWYKGTESMLRLSSKLRDLWYSRSPVIDTIFSWNGIFNCIVVHEDGRVE